VRIKYGNNAWEIITIALLRDRETSNLAFRVRQPRITGNALSVN